MLKALLLFLFVLGLLMAGFGIYFIGLGSEARGWPEAEGKVLRTTVKVDVTRPVDGLGQLTESQREQARRYYPSISYAWNVDGKPYRGSRYQLGTTFEKFKTREEAQAAAIRYPSNSTIPVYYNPEDPSQAVLDKSRSWSVFVPLPLGLLFALMGWLGLRNLGTLREAMLTSEPIVGGGPNNDPA